MPRGGNDEESSGASKKVSAEFIKQVDEISEKIKQSNAVVE